jgi:hypothetical protein
MNVVIAAFSPSREEIPDLRFEALTLMIKKKKLELDNTSKY